ncbi:polysaccharide deacetylase family protein [Haloarchaeobius sp. TZWWS8]|uniref:polysaccharide deacetylase family protein n=1 Tax=Haloarchaeobius sp. TZWWS8 TaxID=3446121 RepID=UPI003EB97B94
MKDDTTRRRALQTIALGSLAGLAGCMGGGSSSPSTSRTDAGTTTTTASGSTTTDSGGSTPPKNPEVIEDFTDLTKFTVKAGRLEALKDGTYKDSEQAALLTRKDKEPVIERPVEADLTNTNLSMAVKLEADKHAVLSIEMFNESESDSVTFAKSIRKSTSGFWQRLDLGATNLSGLPNLGKVTKMRFTLKGAGSGGKIALDSLQRVPSPDKGYVALVFDDAHASDYTHAYQTLKQYDIPATSAVVTNHVGNDGMLNLKQMDEMKSYGWEFCSQTANHANLLNAGRLEVEREIVGAKEWLVDHGFEQGAKTFTYPYGLYTNKIAQFVSQHHEMGMGFFGPRNAAMGYITEPMTISRGDASNIPRAQTMVDLAGLYNDLSILTFHGIGQGGELDVTPEQFEKFAAYLADANVETITLSQIPGKFQPKDGW